MKKEINEVNKGEEIAIGGGLSSLRRKYLKGGTKSSKLGKGDLSIDAGEKIITIKKEIRTQKGSALGGDSSIEEVSKLKKIQLGDVDRESNSAGKLSISKQNRESKNDSNGQTKQTITKIEISNNSENKSGLRGNESVSNNNTNSQNQKGGNSSKITKTTEITTTTNTSGVNKGIDRRSRGKNEVTTTTTTTTTKTTKTEGNVAGNKEVVKTTTTKEGGNSSRKTRTKEEVTTTKTTNTNQRSGGRGNSTQNQVTTTKTTTTTNTLKNGNDKKVVSSQSTSRINNKNESNKITSTNQRSLIAQKSTPALRGNNILPNKDNLKIDKKRPLSTIPQDPEFRNNIVRITIDETGKIPKKEYVLNVRKTDVIRRKNKIRMVYNNDPNKKSVTTEFNHNIKVIKNVTKDLPTVDSLPAGAKIIHRYNFSFNPNIPNTSRHEINETGKIPVKQVQVSPRKNNVIKTERKPLKMTYEMYNSTHQGGTKVIPLPNNLKAKKGIEQVKKEKNNKESKQINVKGVEGSSSNRIRSQASNNRNKGGETTTTTKVTETKISRGKSEGSKTGGKTDETKVTITKTTETRSGKSGNELKITKNASESGKKEGSGDRSSKKNKLEPVTTGQVTVNESGKSKRNRGEGLSTKKEEKSTTSKVTVTKTTESSNAEGSGRLRAGKGSGSKEENKVTNTKIEGSKITTTTTTTTKVETSEGGDGNVTRVKKFKSHRMFKK